ncbi:MAG: hypothetical protein JEY99_17110, partial [Spirochaetales bacterium]|nr:hypothetical protein [Spirochaetales bacterium]
MKRINSSLISTTVRALAQSMTTKIMIILAKKLITDYDIYKRTGFPASIAIPNKDAARQIVTDIVKQDKFLDLVLLLVEIGDKGLMGRKYAIPYMREIISGVFDLGYIYDSSNKIFVENPKYSMTRNWGALKVGEEYTLTFLRLDIVGNSGIVRENPGDKVEATYTILREITQKAVHSRNGRIWGWDGDGGLAVFFFGTKNQSAVMAAMEILHEVYFHNLIDNRLTKPFQIRTAVHSGPFHYTDDEAELKASESVKRVIKIEGNFTKPDTLTISPVVKLMLDALAANQFKPFKGSDQLEYYNYKLRFEVFVASENSPLLQLFFPTTRWGILHT